MTYLWGLRGLQAEALSHVSSASIVYPSLVAFLLRKNDLSPNAKHGQ